MEFKGTKGKEARILEQYEKGFSSSPVEIENENLKLLIKEGCECSRCDKSVFEMYDFPVFKDDEVLCEDCYNELYRSICTCCEESYEIEYESDFFVLNEETAKELNRKPGIYKVLSKPFFYGDIITGFNDFFDGSIELIVPIEINKYKKIDCGEYCQEVGSDMLCQECANKFTKKDTYLLLEGVPCILSKKYENDLFREYSPEELKRSRQKLIHNRITLRGIVQKANSKLIIN